MTTTPAVLVVPPVAAPSAKIAAVSGGISLAGLGTLAVALQQFVAAPHTAGAVPAVLAAVGAFLTVGGFGTYLTHWKTLLRTAEPSTVVALAAARAAIVDAGNVIAVADPGLEARVRAWAADEAKAHPGAVDEEKIAAKAAGAALGLLRQSLGIPATVTPATAVVVDVPILGDDLSTAAASPPTETVPVLHPAPPGVL